MASIQRNHQVKSVRTQMVLLIAVSACSLAAALLGCGKRESKGPAITAIPFQLADRNGATALEFTNWTIVFEAIPARAGTIGSTGVLTFVAWVAGISRWVS